ncbi:MarR family transcriptional regulator [Sulfuriferula plumbiphila]|uniref:MarR family transcriptional regulator n=1 Tax=Sulfuriferula plumbiphila TaxID=171865 RepID=A0A512L678_9PROT|nr:MarR family transcriptional regulator [Sulfuriferula plumbiphila]BBP03578.1 MarR family transcriptional regulator [Sulfuriferula plumbiphila]GEP29979.1 MarR family transcriptional regulator [Sulfuriferula plumbiphila]
MPDDPTDPIAMHCKYWSATFDGALMPLMIALHRVYAAKTARSNAIFSRHGLCPAEFDVLASLRRTAPPHELTPSDVQRSVIITSGGLTKILRQLEARGLVTRSTDASDRRIKPIRLSPSALPIIEQTMQELIADSSTWIKTTLSETEITQVTALLSKLLSPPALRSGEVAPEI